MNMISLNCSSLVGQQAGYQKNWPQSVAAVNDYYRPLDTFADRFEKMLQGIHELGFTAVDIWTAGQLNWAWATPEHITIAKNLLEKYDFTVTSLSGEFGATREEFESACRLALGINTSLLSGTLPLLFTDRAYVVKKLHDYDLRLAIENHPERNPAEMLAKIGDGAEGRIGTSIDTGWYATQGYDAAQAVFDLKDHLLHIHLKDVLPGEHINCGYGKGIVPIDRCLNALKKIGYPHDISLENHTFDHDPTEELRLALKQVEQALD
jgi:L-ribulose-5-phosphate 3-epimerase